MGKSYKRWKRRQKAPVVVEEPKVVAPPKPAPEKKAEVKEKPEPKKSPLSKIRKTKPAADQPFKPSPTIYREEIFKCLNPH